MKVATSPYMPKGYAFALDTRDFERVQVVGVFLQGRFIEWTEVDAATADGYQGA